MTPLGKDFFKWIIRKYWLYLCQPFVFGFSKMVPFCWVLTASLKILLFWHVLELRILWGLYSKWRNLSSSMHINKSLCRCIFQFWYNWKKLQSISRVINMVWKWDVQSINLENSMILLWAFHNPVEQMTSEWMENYRLPYLVKIYIVEIKFLKLKKLSIFWWRPGNLVFDGKNAKYSMFE